MQVSSISLFTLNPTKYSKISDSKKVQSYSTNNDIFVKSNSAISFSGKLSKAQKENALAALLGTGFVGTSLLLTIGTASVLAKSQNPEDIFLSDGTYIGNVKDMSFKSDNLHIDADDGIFQAKGTGIDIRPERFDYIDTKNGIYQNSTKGIDIDLLNNKYIDPENGIFIDPANNITAITNANGELENVFLPAFKGSSLGGGRSMGYIDYDKVTNMSRNEFIERYGTTPEKLVDNGVASTYYDYIVMDNGDYITIDSRSFARRVLEFWKLDPDLTTGNHDIFGRRSILAADGKHQVLIDKDIQNIIDKYNITGDDDIAKATQILQESRLGEYISNNYPDYSSLIPGPSFEDFNKFIGQSTTGTTYDPDKLMNSFKDFSNGRAISFTADAPIDQLRAVEEGGGLFDSEAVTSILDRIEENGEVILSPNSYEALNFALFQNQLIENGDLLVPVIDWTDLIDPENITHSLDSLAHSGIIPNPEDFIDAIKDIIDNIL